MSSSRIFTRYNNWNRIGRLLLLRLLRVFRFSPRISPRASRYQFEEYERYDLEPNPGRFPPSALPVFFTSSRFSVWSESVLSSSTLVLRPLLDDSSLYQTSIFRYSSWTFFQAETIGSLSIVHKMTAFFSVLCLFRPPHFGNKNSSSTYGMLMMHTGACRMYFCRASPLRRRILLAPSTVHGPQIQFDVRRSSRCPCNPARLREEGLSGGHPSWAASRVAAYKKQAAAAELRSRARCLPWEIQST